MNKYYVSLMKFDDELRWGLEEYLYEPDEKELEKDYYYNIPISKELYKYLINKFYERGEDK